MPRISKRRTIITVLFLLPAAILTAWVLWWPWPQPENRPVPWVPDVIVMLGGGDLARVRVASRLATAFPACPILITGDGGYLKEKLLISGVTPSRILIEPDAQSTWENAKLSFGLLSGIKAKRVALVTNWFHVPRAEAVFRKQYPKLDFVVAFEAARQPLFPWDLQSQRREKVAALVYLFRFGVRSFDE